MRCQGFTDETYAFYALDLLEGEEREQVDVHVRSGCETCSRQLARSRSLWYSVGTATALVEPPRNVRADLLKAVGPPAKSWWSWPVFAALTGVTAIAFVVGIESGRLLTSPNNTIAWTAAYPPVVSPPVVPGNVPDAVKPRSPESQPASSPSTALKEIVKQVPDPAQAKAIETLNQDLALERQKTRELQADLARQQTLLAGARTAAAEAEGKLRTASASSSETDVRRQLAAMTQRATDLEKQITQYKVLVEAQRRRLDQTVQIASMVSDPSLRVLRLRPTEKDQSIEAHAAITAGSKMVFFASHLPALPANRTYQLWLVRSSGQAVTSAGVFNADSSSNAVLQLQDASLLSGVTALAVTDEPTGGSKSPTGHKWLIGS